MLGYGIYFSDSLATSLKYAKPSQQRDSCLIAICEVALGKCLDYADFDTTLTSPPEGYDSTRGNKSLAGSKFVDDEYVIYDVSQYKLRYVVELETSRPTNKQIRSLEAYLTSETKENDQSNEMEGIEIDESKSTRIESIEDVVSSSSTSSNQQSSTTSSLKSVSGKPMPLRSVHVRAKIVDMSAKVSLFQEYENEENEPIEAEYLFPLNDGATVCGFEAFINDKHVIGVCKEREQAHREYKEAIAQGKGAYLMDQETNEVFKVNVGNLPPKCKCVIKITYLTELDVQNDR